MKRFALAVALCALAGASVAGVTLEPQSSGVDVRLRGISAVDARIAWASGQQGTILRAGDVLIQRGTNHAWANRSGKPARIAFILVDGKA